VCADRPSSRSPSISISSLATIASATDPKALLTSKIDPEVAACKVKLLNWKMPTLPGTFRNPVPLLLTERRVAPRRGCHHI
jgi:hypothetical protein